MTKKLLTFISFFLAALLFAFFLSNPLTGEEQSDILNFIGRFHPAVLHLPIGFFVILAIFEFLSFIPYLSKVKESIPIVLVLTILVTLLAVFTGLLLAYASGSSEPLVVFHMRASLILGILSLGLGLLKLYGDKLVTQLTYKVTLVAALAVLFITSHNGGSITHGEDYLTKYMPNSLRPMFGLEVEEEVILASVEDLVAYKDVVLEIFEQNCNTCHNPNKKKGELNMKTYEALLKGGEMGYAIAAGDLDDSELFFRITLPHDDEDFMPTDGKPPLSYVEVEVVGWWIQEGADPSKTIAEYSEIPPSVYGYFQTVFDSMVSEEELERREEERELLYQNMVQLQSDLGILIIPIESDSSKFSIETFAVQKTFTDQSLENLSTYSANVVEADFSNTQLTDQALETLSTFVNLRSLNLSNTKIEGEQISKLSALTELESLNLYGTRLSVAQVSELSKLTQLKNLYLFQTDLYEDSVLAQLKESLPDCNFVLN